jgi:hypothetical protein
VVAAALEAAAAVADVVPVDQADKVAVAVLVDQAAVAVKAAAVVVVPVDQAAVAVLVDQAVKVVDVVPAENAEVVDQDVTKKTQVSSNAL